MSERGRALFGQWKGTVKGFTVWPADFNERVDQLVIDLRNEAFEKAIPIAEVEEEVGNLRAAVQEGHAAGNVVAALSTRLFNKLIVPRDESVQ